MKRVPILASVTLLAIATIGAAQSATSDPLQLLMEGNRRFVAGSSVHPRQDDARRAALTRSQSPHSMVLSCADSRVPPEILFDQGLGDLFVVRVAGNIADPHALGSLEYGAQVLGARLAMVLGHESCGAVSAALKGGKAGGHIDSLLRAITPAAERAKASAETTDLLDRAIVENVRDVVKAIQAQSPSLAKLVASGDLRIVGARYDLDTGAVTLVDTGTVAVLIETSIGEIEVEINPVHAPITSANFLRYVDAKMYDGGRFHRAVRRDN